MKVFLDENFLIKEIVDNNIDVIVKGSTNYDEIKIYIPTSLKEQYTTIYPTYSVKRADGREIGVYNTLSTTDLSETGYYGWKGHFQPRDIAVAGALQVTFAFNMTKDSLYQTKTIQMITTKVANAVYVDNEILVIGEGTVESMVDTMNDIKGEMAQLEDTVEDAAETAQEAADAVADKISKSDAAVVYKVSTAITALEGTLLNQLKAGDIVVTSTIPNNAYVVTNVAVLDNENMGVYLYATDGNTIYKYWYLKSQSGTTWHGCNSLAINVRYSSTDKLNADYIQDGTTNKVFTGTEKTKLSGIEGGAQINIIEGVKVNGTAQTPDANKIISLTIPTQASDVNALPNSTKYCASCTLSINSSTYVMSLQLKDQDGNNLGTAKTIDLPLETMVVSGSYDSTNKKVVLTLQNGSTVEFSVADLVSGLQTEITAQNKLSSDLVDDTGHTHKFVNADEKSVIDNIGYLDLTSTPISSSAASPTALTDAQLAEINKKYCIIRYNSTEFYKCNDTGNIIGGNTIIFSKVQIDFANYQEQGTTARYILFYYALIVDQAAKTIYLNTDSKADLYSKAKVDNLLNTKADKSELDSVQTTTDTVANVVDVPTSAKGLATLKQIGGMSYKCKNLWQTANLNITNEGAILITNYAQLEPNTTYTISSNATNGQWVAINDAGTEFGGGNVTTAITFTTTNTLTNTRIYFNSSNSNVNIMLNEGSTALPYEVYYEGIHDSAVTKVESVGANIFDYSARQTETGINSNGEYYSYSGYYALKDIKVLPNTNYHIKTTDYTQLYYFFYDINNNLISYGLCSQEQAITTTANTYYLGIMFANSNTQPMLNKGSTALPYAPYVKYELAIPSAIRSITGYGWGVNENCYNYIDFSLNEFRQYVGRVDLGSLTWEYVESSGKNFFYTTLNEIKDSCIVLNVLYNSSIVWSWENVANKEINTHLAGFTGVNNDRGFYIRDDSYSNASDFKTAMSGVYLYYELATPVITDVSSLLDEVHIPIEAGGTLELVNTYNNAVPVIVSFDNGLVDVVLTNHEHDIEQQREIDKLEQYNASKESILDKMSYNPTTGTLEIRLGDSSNKAEITLNDDNELVLKSYSSDASATTVSLDEDKIVLKYQTDFEEDNITHTLKLDQNGLTYDDSRLDAYYIHNIRLQCNNSTVEELSFKLLRRTATPLTLADLKSEEVYYVKAFDVVAKINNNGNSYFTPVDNMSFYDSSETTMAFNFTYTDQLSDKSLSYDSIDVDVAEVTSVNDTVVEL